MSLKKAENIKQSFKEYFKNITILKYTAKLDSKTQVQSVVLNDFRFASINYSTFHIIFQSKVL